MYTTLRKLKNQARHAKNTYNIVCLPFLIEELDYWPKAQHALFNEFIAIAQQTEAVYPSQITLANKLGISREYCNKLVARLEKTGLLISVQRWNNSCLYGVNPIVWLTPFADKVSRFFPALRKVFLSVRILTWYPKKFTLSNNRLVIRSNNIIEAPRGQAIQNLYDRGPIHDFIKALPFKMNLGQKVFLCSFPHKALEHALNKTLLATGVGLKSPWQYFLAKAYEYCVAEGHTRDIEYFYQLRRTYKIEGEVDLMNAEFVQELAQKREDELMGRTPKEPQKQETINPSIGIAAQIRAMPVPKKQPSKPSLVEPTHLPYIHTQVPDKKPVEIEHAEWLVFLKTEKGKQHEKDFAMLGLPVLFYRQGE